jgi:GxxExxY protein
MLTKSFSPNRVQIIGACIEVHKVLGPGLRESVYHKCLCRELSLHGISVPYEHRLIVNYKGAELDTEVRADFLVEDAILLELKAAESLLPIYEALVLSYMKLTAKAKGILAKFNCTHIIPYGKKSFVNDVHRDLPE